MLQVGETPRGGRGPTEATCTASRAELYVRDRHAADVWTYYSLTRTGRRASALTAGQEASGVNRAVAIYRHVAGVPTDREPPAAP